MHELGTPLQSLAYASWLKENGKPGLGAMIQLAHNPQFSKSTELEDRQTQKSPLPGGGSQLDIQPVGGPKSGTHSRMTLVMRSKANGSRHFRWKAIVPNDQARELARTMQNKEGVGIRRGSVIPKSERPALVGPAPTAATAQTPFMADV
jgi:hypothetical protein